MEYKELYCIESTGNKQTFGLKILVSVDRDFTDEDWRAASRAGNQIKMDILSETLRLSPAEKRLVEEERHVLTSIFPDPIYVEEIPNGYCLDYCCKHRPWYVITTTIGRFKIGWRKRVIEIDWSDTQITHLAVEIFSGEDVTKEDRYIHVWGYDKAKEYVTKLMSWNKQLR